MCERILIHRDITVLGLNKTCWTEALIVQCLSVVPPCTRRSDYMPYLTYATALADGPHCNLNVIVGSSLPLALRCFSSHPNSSFLGKHSLFSTFLFIDQLSGQFYLCLFKACSCKKAFELIISSPEFVVDRCSILQKAEKQSEF